MRVVPVALTLYSRWNFYLAGGVTRAVYQIGPQLCSPVEHCIPYLKFCVDLMGGKDEVAKADLPRTVKSYPLAGGVESKPIDELIGREGRTFADYSGRFDLAGVFMTYWDWCYSTMDDVRANWARKPPAYVWDVWYAAGQPLEMAFCVNDAAGSPTPEFRSTRTSVEHVIEAIVAPDVINNIPKF